MQITDKYFFIREAAIKVLFLVARPIRGGGVKAWQLRKKKLFLKLEKKSDKKMGPLSTRVATKKIFLRIP